MSTQSTRSSQKKGKKKEKGLSLTLLAVIAIFGILFVAILLAELLMLLLVKTGVISANWIGNPNIGRITVLVILVTDVIGLVVTFIVMRFLMRPVNRVIDQMNRLASGDFDARLEFSERTARLSVAEKLRDSFNNMAEELGSTEMLRSDFINNFSHEFKTPIVSIAGFAKLLKRGNLTPAQQAEYLDAIEYESMRLSYMATNVLDLTRVENQTILTGVTTFNLSEQLRSCILLLEHKWSKKRIDWQIDFGEYEIEANKELLKQAWINLLDNAIKFSPEGGAIGVEIAQMQSAEGKRKLRVSIRNAGQEIPPEAQKKIFNKFYQADESHGSEGNGIGLAIVKRVTQLHSGSVSVQSGEGVTTFTVCLPKLQTDAEG